MKVRIYESSYLSKVRIYLTLVRIYESKEIIKKYEELWSKIRNLIRLITKSSDEYDEKYMKIKFDSDNLFRMTYFGYL